MPGTANGLRAADRLHTGIGWRHPHYGELLERQPAIGFLEVHSENFFADGGAALEVLRQGRANYPVSLHGVGLSLGSAAGIDAWHLARLARLVEQVEPVRVSDHASFARGKFRSGSGLRDVHAADLLPVPFSAQALDVMAANVQQVQERLRRPISVENLSAYVCWPDQELAEPAFLSELARRTGCGLLVDVNNIYVNARNHGSDADACLTAIPPSLVAEIHLAGFDASGPCLIDTHGAAVAPEVWALYGRALRRFGRVPTLIEWDTDIPEFAVLQREAATAQSYLEAELAVAA